MTGLEQACQDGSCAIVMSGPHWHTSGRAAELVHGREQSPPRRLQGSCGHACCSDIDPLHAHVLRPVDCCVAFHAAAQPEPTGQKQLVHTVLIRCNRGGCWLECDRCGLLDQGDSSEAIARMERRKSQGCPNARAVPDA